MMPVVKPVQRGGHRHVSARSVKPQTPSAADLVARMVTRISSRAEKSAIVAMAGDVGVEICGRPDGAGWRRIWRTQDLIAYHESAHTVSAATFNCLALRVTIEPRPDERVRLIDGRDVSMLGCCTFSATVQPGDGMEDAVQIRAFSGILAAIEPGPDDLLQIAAARIENDLRQRTENLLVAHWPAVKELAYALMCSRTLEREQIRRILAPHGLPAEA